MIALNATAAPITAAIAIIERPTADFNSSIVLCFVVDF
jgi:hypothetical protein